MTMRKSVLYCVLGALATTPAFGNDGVAELGAGGLVFVQNRDIEMRAEDLFVSQREIRIRYVFFNNSDRDVTVLVAFPFPDLTIVDPSAPRALPAENSEQFIPFSTTVDGRPVRTEVEQRAYGLGIDRTEMLRRLGIPLAPHLDATDQALDRLPRAVWDELITLGLAQIDVEIKTGGAEIEHLRPRWTLKTIHYWKQTFPAKREIEIAHRYTPSRGAYLGSVLDTRSLDKNDKDEVQRSETEIRDHRRKYCIGDELQASVLRALNAAGEESRPIEHYITYILSTALTWAGSIKDFRLVVEKDKPEIFLSFCGTDVRQIGPTQYEMRKQDYSPSADLQVLFLEVYTPAPEQPERAN
jgi:hypothetical protein